MSRFTSFSHPSDFACEAVTPSINHAMHSCDACEQAGDPATLIGLAFAFLRQGPAIGGKVPSLITERLELHAQHGNSACRLVLDWLAKREAVSSMPEYRHPVADRAVLSELDGAPRNHLRLSPRERIMARIAALPPLAPGKTRARSRRRRHVSRAEIISARSRVSTGEADVCEETVHG